MLNPNKECEGNYPDPVPELIVSIFISFMLFMADKLLPRHINNDFAGVGCGAVLENEDALPGS